MSRIVIKLGTSVLTGGSRRLHQPHILELVRQCAQLHAEEHELIICTSGAIAAGKERLNYPTFPNTVAYKQLLAAVGQSRLMFVWERLFEIYDIHVGQLLLTRADLESRRRFLNARDVLHALLEQRILPIINENDAVATEEIKVGDNDNLSAMVAILAEADLLLLLTDQPGLFTADPRTHPDAQLIPEVYTIDETLRRLAGGSLSGLGVGGMVTKLQAADVARRAGTDVIIVAGHAPNIISRAIAGESVGTRFPALAHPLENRKRWILAGPRPSGKIQIDAGATTALSQHGRSLLPAGITHIHGRFERGDTVILCNPTLSAIARGITRYASDDLDKIKGVHSEEINGRLGYDYGAVVVHRNDMIML